MDMMKWSLIQTYNFDHCYRRNNFDNINKTHNFIFALMLPISSISNIGLILERQNYKANAYFHICSYASYSIHI